MEEAQASAILEQSAAYAHIRILGLMGIAEFSEKKRILDFEGSDTESVADFYKKFGAVIEPYTTLYVNKLPFPFSWVKPLPQHYKLLISK